MAEEQLYVLFHSQDGPPALYHQSYGDLEMMAAGVSGIFDSIGDAILTIEDEHYSQFSADELRVATNRSDPRYEEMSARVDDVPQLSYEDTVALLENYASETGGIFRGAEVDDSFDNSVPRDANLLVVDDSNARISYCGRSPIQKEMWLILGELFCDGGYNLIQNEGLDMWFEPR